MYIVNNAAYIRVYLQTKRRKYQNCFTAKMAIKVSALHKIPPVIPHMWSRCADGYTIA